MGDDIPSAAAVWSEAAVRRRRARHVEHGRVEARGSAHTSHANGRGRQYSWESGSTGQDTGVLRRSQPHLVRRQLRISGRQSERPPLRHVRRRQHLQHVLLPSHLDDGGRAAGNQRHRDRSSRPRDPQPRLGQGCPGRLGCQSGAAARRPVLRGVSICRARLQRATPRARRGRRPRAAQEARRHAGDSAEERCAFCRSVQWRLAVHHSARKRLELVVQLHAHPESSVRPRSRPRDGRSPKRRHRIPHDHWGLFPAPRSREVLRLRHRRQPGQREDGARARILCRQPPARYRRGAGSASLGSLDGVR